MFIKKDRNKSLQISAPKEKNLYGVCIRKLPIAKYISFLRAAEELPQILIGKMFPDTGVNGIVEYLKGLDKDKVFDLLTRLLAVVPEELMGLLSELLDIPKERLTEDTPSSLSLAELLEIISAFWELNDMSGFFVTARRLAGKMKAATIGSRVGSPSPKA